jgi:hypothetical protein
LQSPPARIFAFEGAHDLSHVLDGSGLGLFYGRGNRELGLGLAQLLRQKTANDRDFLSFLRGEVQPPSFFVDFLRFLPVFLSFSKKRQNVVVGQGLSQTARLDVLILERGQDHANRSDATLVAGLHRGLELARKFLPHGLCLSKRKKRDGADIPKVRPLFNIFVTTTTVVNNHGDRGKIHFYVWRESRRI